MFLTLFSQKMAAENGLNWPVVQRLENLESILEWIQSNAVKAKYNIASNDQNVILAYRSGVLDWCHGFVTYWHNGAQLCAQGPSGGMNSNISMTSTREMRLGFGSRV